MSEIAHGGVASLIDISLAGEAQGRFTEETRKRSEQAPEAWAWENEWLAEGLRTHVADLEIPSVVDDLRTQLRRLPAFEDDQVRFRNFGWVPDDTMRTHAQLPRLRAVWMNGVDLYLPTKEYPHTRSLKGIFYVGALALERASGIEFEYFASGQSFVGTPYMTSTDYAMRVYDKTSSGLYGALDRLQDEGLIEQSLLAVNISLVMSVAVLGMGERGFQSVDRLRSAMLGQYESLDARKRAYEDALKEVEQEISRRPLPAYRTSVNDDSSFTMQQLVSAKPTHEQPDVLANHLHPLVSWNRAADKTRIAIGLDAFLQNSEYLRQLLERSKS